MAVLNAQLENNQLDIIGDQLGTTGVPAGKTFAITNILVCNQDLVDTAKFDMHIVPNGKPLSNNVTIVVRDLELPAAETFTFDSERIVLEEGDKIVFVAEPDIGAGLTNLAATISYLEV